MSAQDQDSQRAARSKAISRASAALGLVVGLAIAFHDGAPYVQLDLIEQLLLLGPLVGIALGLSLVWPGAVARSDGRALMVLSAAQPVFAVSAVLSVLSPRGARAAMVAAPWVLFTACVGLLGAWRLWHRWRQPLLRSPAKIAMDLALLYLPIGGAWHFFARAALRPLGFEDAIVRLTAVHFHFAGWVAPLFAANVLWLIERTDSPLATPRSVVRAANIGALGAVTGPFMVALGITLSQVTSSRVVEFLSAILLAISLLFLGFATVGLCALHVQSRAARGLLRASSLTLSLTMVLAGVYATERLLHAQWLTIPFMARWHGTANAVGYALFGLAGWAVQDASVDLSLKLQIKR
jgi:hypothetical protein